MRADAMAAEIPLLARKKVTTGERTQWYFTKTIWQPEVSHPVRVAMLWPHWNSTEPAKILATNQTHWEIIRVLRGYGQCWTGTETLHRDGKQHLGFGERSTAERRGPDPAHLSRSVGALSADGPTATGPCECVGE